jgi:SAM-dependent methyltransferase
MREISYEEQTVNSSNPLARLAHRSRMSVALQLTNRLCPGGATVVDFGAGPGRFLHELGKSRHDLHLVGHDPFVTPAFPGIEYVASLAKVDDASVDVLTAFEVCEHLDEHEIVQLLVDAERIMKPDAILIISVPIMYGAAVIPKVLNWMWRNRTMAVGYNVNEILLSMIGARVPRPSNRRETHKGFDFRALRETIGTHFSIVHVRHSPIPQMPWWLNSQYFMICRNDQRMCRRDVAL